MGIAPLDTLAEGIRTGLPLVVSSPVEKRIGNKNLWDLTLSGPAYNREACFLSYGDTILSETIDGWRRWFTIHDNVLSLKREESLRKTVIYRDSITFEPNTVTNFIADVQDSEDNRFIREGRINIHPIEEGLLVLIPGDTIKVLIHVEEMVFDEIPVPIINDELYTNSEIKKYKQKNTWWIREGLVPEAVMFEERHYTDHAANAIRMACYAKDNGLYTTPHNTESYEDETFEEITGRCLEAMTAEWHSEAMTLRFPEVLPIDFTVDVLTDQGLPISHHLYQGNTYQMITINLASIMSGRIIIAVTTPWHQKVEMITKQ